ncbi:MAG TPA: MFS transporter [Ktedonobacteraceae bacterium]|nr:MFS transporter [Ktedonobacteraceae bacterium]
MSELPSSANVELRTARRRSMNYPMYVFYVLFAISVLNAMDRYILTGAANVVAKELHLTIDDIGYLSSAFIIFFTFSVLPFGIWSDRTKRKNVIAIAVAIWSIATVFTTFATNFATLFLSRTVLGVGEAGYSPSSPAIISDYFGRIRRARIMGWWASAGLIGLMIGTILGGVVAGLYTGAWRLAFLFTGIPGLLLAWLAWRLREPRRNQADDEERGVLPDLSMTGEFSAPPHSTGSLSKAWSQLWALLHIKTLLVLIMVQIFTFFVTSGTVTYLSIYLQQKDTLGMTSAQAGLFTGIGIVLAGVIGVVLGGYLSDLLSRRYAGARILICGLSFLLSAPTYAASALIAVNMHNLGLYTIFFVLTTILLNLSAGPAGAATQDVVPSSLRASAVAVSVFVGHILGDAFAPALIGRLARSFDPTGAHFANNLAGHDLTMALIYTYPTSLFIAGIIGIIGARWLKADQEAAQRADMEALKAQ